MIITIGERSKVVEGDNISIEVCVGPDQAIGLRCIPTMGQLTMIEASFSAIGCKSDTDDIFF